MAKKKTTKQHWSGFRLRTPKDVRLKGLIEPTAGKSEYQVGDAYDRPVWYDPREAADDKA